MNKDSDDQKKHHIHIQFPRGDSGQLTAADRFLKGDQLDSFDHGHAWIPIQML